MIFSNKFGFILETTLFLQIIMEYNFCDIWYSQIKKNYLEYFLCIPKNKIAMKFLSY